MQAVFKAQIKGVVQGKGRLGCGRRQDGKGKKARPKHKLEKKNPPQNRLL
jgi:hypothetical protein